MSSIWKLPRKHTKQLEEGVQRWWSRVDVIRTIPVGSLVLCRHQAWRLVCWFGNNLCGTESTFGSVATCCRSSSDLDTFSRRLPVELWPVDDPIHRVQVTAPGMWASSPPCPKPIRQPPHADQWSDLAMAYSWRSRGRKSIRCKNFWRIAYSWVAEVDNNTQILSMRQPMVQYG